MNNFKQNIESIAFTKAYNELKLLGKFKTDSELCNKIDYKYNNMHQVITGKRNIPREKLNNLCEIYNLNLRYFTHGNVDMFLNEQKKHTTSKTKDILQAMPSNINDKNSIPLLDTSIEAGVIKGFVDAQVKSHLPHYIVPGFKGADFLATISGESMIDRYWPGDVVGCKIITNSGFIQWGKTHILDTSQGGLIKKIMPSEKEDFIKAVSFNDANYPSFDVPKNEINGMAIVLGVVRLV